MPRRGENIRKRQDGRWEGRYIKDYSSNGQAIYGSVYAKSYIEVKQKTVAVRQSIQTRSSIQRCEDVCFSEVLFQWLKNNKIKIRPQTYAKYLNAIENHLAETIGSYGIAKIDATIINDFLDEKKKQGRLDSNGGLSTSYVKTLIYIINSAIKFAVTHAYRSPLCGEINKPVQKKTACKVLSAEEQNRLENFISNDMDGTKLGVLICLHMGLRIGEICGLQWSDIDFWHNTLTVRRTVYRITNDNEKSDGAKTKLTVGEPKSESSNRTIPIPAYLVSVISEYKKGSSSIFVVSDNDSGVIDPRTYQYRFHRYLKESCIDDINFHALRHTFATRCIEVGMDIKSLSEILGHASVNITLNTYVHSSIEQKRCQMELLSSIWGQEMGQDYNEDIVAISV